MQIFNLWRHDDTFQEFCELHVFLREGQDPNAVLDDGTAARIEKTLSLFEKQCEDMELTAVAQLINFTRFQQNPGEDFRRSTFSEADHRFDAIEFLFNAQSD